jgi:DNA-binding GntR family transcriptional regulator
VVWKMKKRELDNHAIPNIIKQSIIDEIMQGEIKSGDKLVETKYSELFGTSRAPVREAFYLLTMEGYVEKVPRKGTVVKAFTLEEMRDVLDIRNFLEQLSIDRMDQNKSGQYLQQMRNIIQSMENKEVERKEYAKLNYEFHFQLILASQSEIIQNTYSRLATQLLSLQTISFLQEAAIKKSIDEHKEIVEYLAEGNFKEAKTILNAHNTAVYPRIKISIK